MLSAWSPDGGLVFEVEHNSQLEKVCHWDPCSLCMILGPFPTLLLVHPVIKTPPIHPPAPTLTRIHEPKQPRFGASETMCPNK